MGTETPQRLRKEAAGSRHEPGLVRQTAPASTDPIGPQTQTLLEEVLRRENLRTALKRVQSNKGAPGVDGMRVEDLPAYLRTEWHAIREQRLDASDIPSPVREVRLPKPGGGTRMLGIPTVLDRFMTQAIVQVLSPLFDPGCSDHSYGVRPGRSALHAVGPARDYISRGHRGVVDLDVEKFFDQVNHEMLVSRVASKGKDTRLLKRIRRYLNAGIMKDGMVSIRHAGTPQGSPLSPLLSNILLDDFDKALERRGHCFCRYADDVNVYVRSRRAGERVMESRTRFLEGRMRVKVNRTKSAVDRPLEAHVSRRHGHDPLLPPIETRSCVAHTRQGSDPTHHARGPGTKQPYGDRRGESVHPRMGWLLSPGHSDRPVRHTRSMDSPAPPQNPVGAMEETADSVSQNGRTGTRGGACAQGHRHRARRLVERGGLAHACGREQSLACGVGTPEPSDSTPGSAAAHLNRRVRNRTHGGVGGREG